MNAFSSQSDRLEGDNNVDPLLMGKYLQESSPPLFSTASYGCPAGLGSAPMYHLQHAPTWSSESHTSSGTMALSPPADSDAIYEGGARAGATPDFLVPSSGHESDMMPIAHGDGHHHLQYVQFDASDAGTRPLFINPSDINPYHLSSPSNHNIGIMGLVQHGPQDPFEAESPIDPSLLPGGKFEPFTSTIFASQEQKDTETGDVPTQEERASRSAEGNKPRHDDTSMRSTTRRRRARGKKARIGPPRQTNKDRVLPRSPGSESCKLCNEEFTDTANLRRHVRNAHNRPYTCIFHYADCPMSFAGKNEWKRHIASQHLFIFYWHCTQDHCSLAKLAPSQRKSPGIPSHGCVFNRKDLFTQHFRRMHLKKDDGDGKKSSKDDKRRLEEHYMAVRKQRCELPLFMECPASGCTEEFHGPDSWNARLDHVARHLSRAAAGKEPEVFFGGDNDPTLTNWAASPEISITSPLLGGGWELVNYSNGVHKDDEAPSQSSASALQDQDAEWDFLMSGGEEEA